MAETRSARRIDLYWTEPLAPGLSIRRPPPLPRHSPTPLPALPTIRLPLSVCCHLPPAPLTLCAALILGVSPLRLPLVGGNDDRACRWDEDIERSDSTPSPRGSTSPVVARAERGA